MSARKTINQRQVVETANRMIVHLAASGTHADQLKREAIIAVTSQVLLDGNAYAGFRYMNQPVWTQNGLTYDETRVQFLAR